MNESVFFSFLIFWVLFIGLLLLAAGYLLRRWYVRRHSHVTKRYASRIFRRHGMLRGWKVFADVTLGEGASAVVADQLVVAPFGVIVACDLHQKGNLYGDLDAAEWILANGEDGKEKKERIASPYHTAKLAVEQLRRLLAKEKIYNVPIELMVPKTMKQGSYITGSNDHLYDLKNLKKQLEKGRYEKDNGVKVEQIAALFQ